MSGLRGKDCKRSGLRDARAGAYDRAASKEDMSRNVVPGNDMPEGLQRKRTPAPNKSFRRGGRAKHVFRND